MKYIDADKLKTEIERLKKRTEHYEEISLTDGERSYWSGVSGALELLSSFITSLQQEQPEVDLENYLENYFKGWHIEEEIGLTKPDGWSCIVDDLKDIARHFAEWGAIHLNARKEK